MPSPETPRSSTSSVPDSDADIGLRQAWTGSALPISLQSVSRGVNVFGASTVRTFVTACQFARPPCTDPTGFPAVGDFYYQASNGSVALPVAGYNYNSDWTPLLVGFAPTGMAASLAAPKLSFILGAPREGGPCGPPLPGSFQEPRPAERPRSPGSSDRPPRSGRRPGRTRNPATRDGWSRLHPVAGASSHARAGRGCRPSPRSRHF